MTTHDHSETDATILRILRECAPRAMRSAVIREQGQLPRYNFDTRLQALKARGLITCTDRVWWSAVDANDLSPLIKTHPKKRTPAPPSLADIERMKEDRVRYLRQWREEVEAQVAAIDAEIEGLSN